MKNILIILSIFFNMNISAYISQSGIRAQSLGKAYRSLALSNDIILYNPAGILKHKKISLDLDYHNINSSNNMMISIVDSKSTDWAIGILYDLQLPQNKLVSHSAYITSAIPLINDILFFGTSLNYLNLKNNNFTSMDFGLLLDTNTGLSLAASSNHSFYFTSRHLPANMGIGISYDFHKILHITQILIAIDWQMNDAFSENDLKHELNFGVEYIFLESFPLRVGYNHVNYNNEKFISFGTGFVASTIDFDLLYRQNILLGKERDFGFSLKLKF